MVSKTEEVAKEREGSTHDGLKFEKKMQFCSVHKICAGASAGTGAARVKMEVRVRCGWKCDKSYLNIQRHTEKMSYFLEEKN